MDIVIKEDCKFATKGGLVVVSFKAEQVVSDLIDKDALRMVELKMATEAPEEVEEVEEEAKMPEPPKPMAKKAGRKKKQA